MGATGYIGRYVVRELLRRGHRVLAVARSRSGIRGRNSPEDVVADLTLAQVVFSDVTDPAALLADLAPHGPVHAAVCCLASRGGGVQDSWRVDYRATQHMLQAARGLGAAHFVLLSSICVQKPLLEFQRAKLKFEELATEAARDPGFTYSVVRPTAFFKSLGGQVDIVENGQPYVMFGDGKLCTCKPISEEDLAAFIADCIYDQDKANKVLPIGGPGKALTPLEQGEMLFRLLGREPKFIKVPIQIMDAVIWMLDAKLFPWLEDVAEFGKIGRYYALESMLLLDPETGEYSDEKTPSYGKDMLEQFFQRVIRYINYVRKEFKPVLTKEAERVISSYYQLQRKSGTHNAARTTVRMLESLIRLGQAHARLMCSNEVTQLDVIAAILCMESSMTTPIVDIAGNALHSNFTDHPDEEYKTQEKKILKKLGLTQDSP